MANQTALFWLSVTALIGFGLTIGQIAAVTVAAMAAVAIACQRVLPHAFLPAQSPSR